MKRAETASKETLLLILDLLERLGIPYWVDGGWGVDLLLGRQSREHRDVDIDFDGRFTEVLLHTLQERGYVITTDWSPCRLELQHPEMGYLDIHPLAVNADGSAKQADLEGGWYHLEACWFSSAVFEGREVPCISAEAQRIFHSGYELREKDVFDLQSLERLLSGEKQASPGGCP